MSIYHECKRTVQALNNVIAEKDKALEENSTEIDTLVETVQTLKEQTGEYRQYFNRKNVREQFRPSIMS